MGRVPRVDIGGEVYHVINRANGRGKIFDTPGDYLVFENVLREAITKCYMRLLAYSIMPNHWHLVIWPRRDGDMSKFIGWLTLTHTQRYRAYKESVGDGHLYQGRYKSFLIETDKYFVRLCRYVERNAFRAGLVKIAQGWRWGSAWIRNSGSLEQKKLISDWPVPFPDDFDISLNENDDSDAGKFEIEAIRNSVNRGLPFGGESWAKSVINKYKLEPLLHLPGRPKKTVPGTI